MTYLQNTLAEKLYAGRDWKPLKESNCAVIDFLVKEFGEHMVYGGWRDINGCVSSHKDQILDKAYDALDMIVFGNVLKKPQIESISQIEAQNIFGNDKLGQYRFNVNVNKMNGKVVGMKIVPGSSKIAIVLDEVNAPFMYVVDLLCHQMLHQYVFEVGEGIPQLFQAIVDEKQYNVHDGQFKKAMDQLNKETGLIVEEDYSPMMVGFVESTYKARSMNDEYEGKEELGLYDGIDGIREDFLDDERGTIPEDEDEYLGDTSTASLVQGSLESSTYVDAKQRDRNTIQITMT